MREYAYKAITTDLEAKFIFTVFCDHKPLILQNGGAVLIVLRQKTCAFRVQKDIEKGLKM